MEAGQKNTDTAVNIFEQPADTDVLTDYIQKQLEAVSYEIDKIVDYKKNEEGVVSYNVQWLAHTWIPAEILSPFQYLISKYWEERSLDTGKDELLHVTEEVIGEGQSNVLDINRENNTNNEVLASISNGSNSTSVEKSEMHCQKCSQRFYLKSNLEVHLLFCEKVAEQRCSKIENQNLNINELHTATNTSSSLDVNSVRDALKISQTFEYIPLSNGEGVECKSCLQRFPNGPTINNIDVTELLWNANKRVCSDQVEVFECLECHRDYLYKHYGVAVEESTKMTPPATIRAKKLYTRPFKCSICNRGFENEQDMKTHETKHSTSSARYSCAKCTEKFSTRVLLQDHYNSKLNTCAPRKCNICSREFVHSNHLRRHMSIHAGVKPFVCSICSHEFNQKSDLKRHEKRHSVEGRLACVKCDLIFNTAEELRDHIVTHKNGPFEKMLFKCELCTKVFGRKSHYKRHLTIHKGLKPHVCQECGKSFNQNTDLKRHHMTHIRNKDITAGNKTVSTPTTDLSTMIKNDKFLCQICNKTFLTQSQYDAHEMTHNKIMNTGLS